MRKLLLLCIFSGLLCLPLIGQECDGQACDAGCDHSHDGGPPVPGEHHDVRRSPLLSDAKYQEPAQDPVIMVYNKEKILEGEYIAPVFTADSENIIVTSLGYRGIWIGDIRGNEVRKISDASLASWRPYVIDEDAVYFRTADFSETGDVTYSIQKYEFGARRAEILYQGEKNENIYSPVITKERDSLLYIREGGLEGRSIREVPGVRSLEERKVKLAYSDVISGEGAVYVNTFGTRDSQKISVGDVAGAEVMSPDGKKVVYLSSAVAPGAGGGMIYDLETDTQIEVGEGTGFAWSPDSQWLVYEVVVDDGHIILQSELFIIRADGTNRQRITFDEGIALQNPSWSPDGRKIVAEDIFSGSIYMLEVEFIDETKKGGR